MPSNVEQDGFSRRHCAAVAISSAVFGCVVLLLTGGAGSVLSPVSPVAATLSVDAPNIVIIKHRRVLHLFDGGRLVRSYPVDLGTVAVGEKRRKGDGRTPVGRFQIVTKNIDSPYHRFLGISYPHAEAAAWGLAHGWVSLGQAAAVRGALKTGDRPDWNTPLGGGIGIHGGRRGGDWTGGCVALSNDHVAELFGILRIGDPVEILP